MKFVFWEYSVELFGLISAMLLCFLGTITFLTLSFFYSHLWICTIVFLMLFIICLCALFFNKKYLSKIIFTEKGLQIIWYKKKIGSFDWSEILEAQRTPFGRGISYLTLITMNNQVNIFISSQKMYDAIIATCSNANLKYTIENLNFLKCFRRKKKK